MNRFHLFLGAWSLTAAFAFIYIVWGTGMDISRRVVARRQQRVLDVLSVVLFEPDEDAARIHLRAQAMPKRPLLNVIQSLAVDLNGQAQSRLQQLVRALGLERYIRRRARSRRWRMRTQAAQLQYLVDHPDFDRRALLKDKHHIVRARAVESLTPKQGGQHIDLLLGLLEDPSIAVRLAVQQKLLDVGSAAVPHLLDLLENDGAGVREALEVAANLPDPRLVDALDHHATVGDAETRETAARALGSGSGPGAADILTRLCSDDDAAVRVAAIEGLARMEAQMSVAAIGRRLSDEAWMVRRAAGLALDRLGAPGSLILRNRLGDADPYARDMARQILDAAAARDGIALVPPLEDALAGLVPVLTAADVVGGDADDGALDALLAEVPAETDADAFAVLLDRVSPIAIAEAPASEITALAPRATEDLFDAIDESMLEALLGGSDT